MDLNKIIAVNRAKNVHRFAISGKYVDIGAFLSLNCLEKLFQAYEECGDYRQAFSQVVFYMYSKTIETTLGNELLENEFYSASDEELSKILEYLLTNDERVREEYDKIECDSIYERFYKANDNLLKKALKPITDSLKQMNRVYTPQFTGIQKALEQQSTLMKKIQIPNFDAISDVAVAFQIQAKSINEQFRYMNLENLKKISNFNFPEIQLVLDNIPKVAFDVSSIMLPLVNQVAEMNETIRTSMLSAISAITKPLATIDFSLLTYHQNWSEKHDLLVKFGWLYLNEMPKEVIDSIYERRDDISSDEVDEIVSRHFRQNRCFELKRIVRKWDSSTYFKPRARIFHEALVNHSRRYFNSSTTILVLHTEGVITDFVRLKLQMPRFKAHKAITDITDCLDDIPKGLMSLSDWEIYNCVFERISDSFQEGFSHANPDNASNGSRDKIAHGHAVERETEVSSLKQFLYLNEIYRLFTFFDESTLNRVTNEEQRSS